MWINVTLEKGEIRRFNIATGGTLATLRESIEEVYPSYEKNGFSFLMEGKQVAVEAEAKSPLAENINVALILKGAVETTNREEEDDDDEGDVVRVRLHLENGQRKIAYVSKGQKLSDLRSNIDSTWTEVKGKNYFFYQTADNEHYSIEKADEDKIVCKKGNVFAVKFDEDIASELVRYAQNKDNEAKKLKKEKKENN